MYFWQWTRNVFTILCFLYVWIHQAIVEDDLLMYEAFTAHGSKDDSHLKIRFKKVRYNTSCGGNNKSVKLLLIILNQVKCECFRNHCSLYQHWNETGVFPTLFDLLLGGFYVYFLEIFSVTAHQKCVWDGIGLYHVSWWCPSTNGSLWPPTSHSDI